MRLLGELISSPFLNNMPRRAADQEIAMKKPLICLLAILFAIGIQSPARAKIRGNCSNCHTMHNSQGGLPMAYEINESLSGYTSDQSPNPSLLVTNCIGCHSSTGSSVIENGVPIVFNMGAAPANYLAAGNFCWVRNDDAKGHNVLGISPIDSNLTSAPGNPWNCANSCHISLAVRQTAIDALGSGCEGCHLNVKHHADKGTGTKYVNAFPWYRFLSGHMSGENHGVEGIEDEDRQYTYSPTDHNEYQGMEGDYTSPAGFYNLGNTMTAFCCGCHGNFHIEQDSGSWIRHPSDASIPNSGEYAAAFGESHIYNPLVPVARPTSFSWTGGPSPTVTIGTDMVMCLSCHRAHGSPYYKMMRWDYMNWPENGYDGCGTCHTSKN